MMKIITKTKEFECPCCGEKFNITLTENGEIVVTPFILSENNCISAGMYNFGVKGGENL